MRNNHPEPLTQMQVAKLLGLTERRVRQLDHEPNPPQRNSSGGYPAIEFGVWLRGRWLRGSGTDGETSYEYISERARLTHHLANMEAGREKELRESLVPNAEARDVWERYKEDVTAILLPVSGEIGTACAMLPAVEVEGRARTIVYRMLHKLAGKGKAEG
jgi:hypothetical protein